MVLCEFVEFDSVCDKSAEVPWSPLPLLDRVIELAEDEVELFDGFLP